MTDRILDSEDRAIERALDLLMESDPQRAAARESWAGEEGEAPDEKLVREYTELLGLLPYELEAETPPASLKETILARTAATPAVDVPAAGVPAAGAPAAGAPAAGAPEMAPVVPFERPAPSTASRSVWSFAQAAVLAASLVGLGFLSATVWQQSRQIDQLNLQMSASALQLEEAQRVHDETLVLKNRLHMVTNVARQAYPMRMVSAAGPNRRPGAAPDGIVYVCGMHQRWYLNLRGLEPPAEGEEYHIWFMTQDGKVDGGILDVRADAPAEMEAMNMPKGTHGFLVTLERPNEPEGLEILLGENAVNL